MRWKSSMKLMPSLVLLALLSTACSKMGQAEELSFDAPSDAAEAAAAAAADAANAANSSSNSAAALSQMGVGHIVAESSDVSLASLIIPDRQSRTRSASAGHPSETRAADAEQAMLAYEHDVEIRLDAEQITEKVQAVRKACESSKFGACIVLQVSQSGGRYAQGSLRLRAEPRAIEPLIAAAGEGGDIGDRRTSADDLAVVVRDNNMLQNRLRKQHARLLEFQDRSDLKVTDVIALSEQLSKVEAELEAAERDGAVHKRRIETQLLSIEFSPFAREEQRGEVVGALRDSGSLMAASAGGVIRAAAVLVPIFLAFIASIWFLRRLWRFMRRRKSKSIEND